jgi:DNA polymerase-3 subunit epsilon
MTIDLDRGWTEQPIALIDFETCGLEPGDGVVEVAVARVEGMRVVSTWSSLVNPGKPIPEAASAVHGIKDADVADAPSMAELAGLILRICQDATPGAYNAGFDRAVLHHFITGSDCPAFDPSFAGWLDPLVVVKDVDRFVSGKGRHKLENVCRRWSVGLTNAHRALGDVVATAGLLIALHEAGKLPAMPLGKLLTRIEMRRAAQEADFQAWLARQPKTESA